MSCPICTTLHHYMEKEKTKNIRNTNAKQACLYNYQVTFDAQTILNKIGILLKNKHHKLIVSNFLCNSICKQIVSCFLLSNHVVRNSILKNLKKTLNFIFSCVILILILIITHDDARYICSTKSF